MSIWVIGLGASVGYLMYMQQRIGGRLEEAVRQYDERPGIERAPELVHIQRAKRDISSVDREVFDERLPRADRDIIEQQASALERERDEYNGVAAIEGVYLETGLQ